MEKVLAFLKECGVFFLATEEGDQPRVRPFGAVAEIDGKMYFITGNRKSVFAQLTANPKVEICACKGPEWLRIQGEAVVDDRREARVAMLEAAPSLKSMYSADDGIMAVFYLKNAKATFSSFSAEPQTVEF